MTADDFEVVCTFSLDGSVDLYCPDSECHWNVTGARMWKLGELRELAQAHLDEEHPVSPGPSSSTS